MRTPAWNKAIKESADPQRARHFIDLLGGTPAREALLGYSEQNARIVASVCAGSQALGALLAARPGWLPLLRAEGLEFPRRKGGLAREADQAVKPLLKHGSHAEALNAIREFKLRETLRIAARDLARIGRLPDLIQEISDVADVCLDAVWRICLQQLAQRHGLPWQPDQRGTWKPTTACVIGLGKLGGQELNYSSDVDVVFVYSGEGGVFASRPAAGQSPRPTLTNHHFFNRLAEAFIAEVTRLTEQGMLYRIDLRLRPEGDQGPLTRSLEGYENYYAQWGQTWERMMLIKARGVAGDQGLAAEFLETVQPFRYPRSTSQNVLREVAAMKDRIENEVVREGELERNVKLGRGGIREIEFIVQSIQLLRAGRQPFLQGSQTLPGLEKLAQYELLPEKDTLSLAAAYVFLRDVEHRLQMEDNRQTHTIPPDRAAQTRLARLMGFAGTREFESARAAHAANVRRIFDRLLKADERPADPGSDFPATFDGFEAQWKAILEAHRFRDAGKALRMLREFVDGPGFIHLSTRTREIAAGLLPRLFALCRGRGPTSAGGAAQAPLSDPDRVVTRLDSFIGAYGARATLFELWNSNPAIFDMLVLLFDRSEFLAELAIRTPDLVDELVTSDRLRERKTAEQTLADLRHGIADADQHLWLRKYHQAELMRIGLRDILGLADVDQYLIELSALAEACLQYALEVTLRAHKLKTAPFVILGLGKLGGREIDYGSDLDIVFVSDAKSASLARLSRMAVEIMDLVSRRTEQGMLFHTDARLRPDGEKGLLVNTLKAHETYYRKRAQLWEIQSLSRVRPVAGDVRTGVKYQALAARLTDFKGRSAGVAAWSPDWKSKIHQMRLRIEKERTPAGKDALAIKTGRGGLMDAEFIAQALCLEKGRYEPNTLLALQPAQKTGELPGVDTLIFSYHNLRRVEGILRRWSYEGETVLPDDPAPYYRVSVRCGFASPEDFRQALAGWRAAIREVYLRFFDAG
jgi:glutamate-ammonia-ligase adenylyltransferase